MNNLLCKSIIVILFLNVSVIFSQENYYPRESEKKSEYYDGPYVYYEDSTAVIINAVEEKSKMVLSIDKKEKQNLKSINVYKPGFMPRNFSVNLKSELEVEPYEFKNIDKLFVLSDYEGNFNSFVNLLQQHNVLNQNLSWNFGSGHLVIIGDVFDRGIHQTEMLWLIYKLEEEAITKDGYVHFILGNHEVMNLKGDLRYLEQKYNVLNSLVSAELNLSYVDLIGSNSELGRWLRTKNAVEKIDNKIFVHAGISPKVCEAGLTIKEINNLLRQSIDKDKSEYNFADSLLLKRNGPLWYRGYFNEEGYEDASEGDVKKILEKYETEFIFVGHTRFEKPTSFYDGHIKAINVNPIQDHQFNIPKRKCYGILIDKNEFFIADENGYIEKF